MTVADYQWAGWVRAAAYTIRDDYLEPGRKAYVNAEWGFQYYMAQAGAEILDLENQRVEKGSYVILPTGNTNPRVPRWGDASRVAVLQTPETGCG